MNILHRRKYWYPYPLERLKFFVHVLILEGSSGSTKNYDGER